MPAVEGFDLGVNVKGQMPHQHHTPVEGLVTMGALETRLFVEGQMPLVLVLVSKSFGTNFAENRLHFEMD